jgi:hypothetical protein
MPLLTALLVITLLASPPPSPSPPSPRVIVTLTVPRDGQPQIAIENAAGTPAVLSGVSYLSLSSPDEFTPRYWARLDTEATPSRHGAVTLAARSKTTVSVNPSDLLWAADRSGTSPEQPLGRAVLPGTYTLQVQVQTPGGAAWRSNDVQVTVGRSGSLRYK